MKELIPEKLQAHYLRGKFTKDMGHSCWADGSFSIGHEIRLSVTDAHEMAYAYIPDHFWDEQLMKHAFENVVYSYWLLTEIASRLPQGVEFICQDRDDFGVTLTTEVSSIDNDELFRRKAVLMVRDDQEDCKLGQGDYEDIMTYYGLNERFSTQEFIDMCHSDINTLRNREQDINARLRSFADKATICFEPEKIAVYLMEKRNDHWGRECCLRFGYDSDLAFLNEIEYYLKKAQELGSAFTVRGDDYMTVGLLSKNKEFLRQNNN